MEAWVCSSCSRASRRSFRLDFCRGHVRSGSRNVQKLIRMATPCVVDKAYLEPTLLPVDRKDMVKLEGLRDGEWSNLHLLGGWRGGLTFPAPGQPAAQWLRSLMRNQDADIERAVPCSIVESRSFWNEIKNNHGLSIDMCRVAAQILELTIGGINSAAFMLYIVEFGIDIAAHSIMAAQGLRLPAQMPATFDLAVSAAIFAIQQGQMGLGMAALRHAQLRLIPLVDRELMAKPCGRIIRQGSRHLVPAANIVIVIVPIEDIRLHVVPARIVDDGTAPIEGGEVIVCPPNCLPLLGVLRDPPVQAPLLVIDSPENDAGMIAIARDHRGQLSLEACDGFGRVAPNTRRFSPHQQTQTVGPVEPARVL